MGKYSNGKAWLQVLVVKQDGKVIDGDPTSGEHTIALKPGLAYHGDREYAVKLLQDSFPRCTFAWEK